MRVLIVQHGAFPGSVAPIPKEIAKHLHRLGVEVEVAALANYTWNNGERFDFPIHVINSGPSWKRYAELRPHVCQADIVHYFPGKGLELMPLLSRRPRYIFNHISVSVTGRWFRDTLINCAKRMQPALADVVACTDPELARNLSPLPSKPIEILPVGYAADLFYPCTPFVESDSRLLLYHGACRPQRRLDRLIEVMPLLSPRYRLKIIGGGSPADEAYRDHLAVLAKRLNVADRVELTNMPQAEIRKIIESAYLCLSYVPVIESFQDQFVLKTLEYLACHRAVLSTATRYTVRFHREIGANRLLVVEDTAEAMAAAIEGSSSFVRAFHERENLRSLDEVMPRYTSARIVEERLIPMYRRLLSAR